MKNYSTITGGRHQYLQTTRPSRIYGVSFLRHAPTKPESAKVSGKDHTVQVQGKLLPTTTLKYLEMR